MTDPALREACSFAENWLSFFKILLHREYRSCHIPLLSQDFVLLKLLVLEQKIIHVHYGKRSIHPTCGKVGKIARVQGNPG